MISCVAKMPHPAEQGGVEAQVADIRVRAEPRQRAGQLEVVLFRRFMQHGLPGLVARHVGATLASPAGPAFLITARSSWPAEDRGEFVPVFDVKLPTIFPRRAAWPTAHRFPSLKTDKRDEKRAKTDRRMREMVRTAPSSALTI